jgi:F-type H+-transporting ATPase subunit delta
VKAGPVALRYATALFELALEKGVLERVEADVERVAAEVSDQQVAAWLFDARIPGERKREQLERLAQQLHPLTANFLRLLADKRRLAVLRDLRPAFRRSLLAERNATEGVVESPRELAPNELARLSEALGRMLGKHVELESRLRPELIAGVRVFVDNKLIDQSAAGRLEGLRGRLRHARLA